MAEGHRDNDPPQMKQGGVRWAARRGRYGLTRGLGSQVRATEKDRPARDLDALQLLPTGGGLRQGGLGRQDGA